MPIVTFYMKETYKESVDDLILSYNESKGKDEQITDISDWERWCIREYLNQFMMLYRDWEVSQKITNPVTKKPIDAELTLDLDSVPLESDDEDTSTRPYMRKLQLGNATILWLKRSSLWNNAIGEILAKVNKQEYESKIHPISHVIADVISSRVVTSLVDLDKKELDEEKKLLKKELDEQKPKKSKTELKKEEVKKNV